MPKPARTPAAATARNRPWLSANAESVRFRRSRLGAAFGAAAALVVSYLYAPFVDAGPVLCPLHALMGLPCPCCGLTHAFCALARLDIRAALSAHGLAPLVFSAVVLTPAVCGYELATGRRLFERWFRSRTLAGVVASVFAVHHAVRLSVWVADGTLVSRYVETSWTYTALVALRCQQPQQ
jgi:hypothetical protein